MGQSTSKAADLAGDHPHSDAECNLRQMLGRGHPFMNYSAVGTSETYVEERNPLLGSMTARQKARLERDRQRG
jgi:hypothetical protein